MDERTGEVHDYTRRSGVVSSHIVLPNRHPDWAESRSQLWSGAELAETRKNSVVAREAEIALPAELSPAQREELATGFAAHLVDRYGVAAEVSIHEPSREGDQRNHHAHILFTTRRMDETGFIEKTRELDDKKTGPEEIEAIRKGWEDFQNRALDRAGSEKRVDCRSLVEQRIEAQEIAEEYEQRAVAIGEQKWGSLSLRPDGPGPLKKLSAVFSQDVRGEEPVRPKDEARKWQEMAAEQRQRADNLNREPGRHKGPFFAKMEQRIKDKAERLQEAVQSQLQSLRDRFEALRDRFTSQEQRIEDIRQEQNREGRKDTIEALRRDEDDTRINRLMQDHGLESPDDVAGMDTDKFEEFERARRNRLDEIARADMEVEDQITHEDKEKFEQRKSAAERLAEIRNQDRNRDAEKRIKRDLGRDSSDDFGL